MGIGGIGGGSPLSRLSPSPSANETQGLDKDALMKALQGDPKAIEQLAKKLGMDPEQLKELLKALGGGQQAEAPAGGGGGGAPEGAGGGGKPEGAGGGQPPGGAPPAQAPATPDAAASVAQKFAENIQKGMPPQQALAQAIKDVKAEQPKTKGQPQPGHARTDSYEAAPNKGPVDLQGAPPRGNTLPAPIEPESI